MSSSQFGPMPITGDLGAQHHSGRVMSEVIMAVHDDELSNSLTNTHMGDLYADLTDRGYGTAEVTRMRIHARNLLQGDHLVDVVAEFDDGPGVVGYNQVARMILDEMTVGDASRAEAVVRVAEELEHVYEPSLFTEVEPSAYTAIDRAMGIQ